MAEFFKAPEAATLALHAMAVLAGNGGKLRRTKEIADALGVSGNHLSKVLQRLRRAGLVSATRGPAGGFKTVREPKDVTLLEIYEAVEGSLEVPTCMFSVPVCGGNRCPLGRYFKKVNREIVRKLNRMKLSEIKLDV